ncbi:MAG TPA: DUF4337 family protein [Candidatus Acidoferrum sp.]|nr:DUF4337 family protein [Candidatus Acidoferrum sp.]
MSDAAKAFEEADERHAASGARGPRWVPLAAAVLAVLAAVSGVLSNLRATRALITKNDSIIATARASDTYNEYEAGRIKYYVYQAAIDTGRGSDVAKLNTIAGHEASKGAPLLKKARVYEEQARDDNERSEHLVFSHEVLEVATTLFEISIVLVSITALVGSRLLPIVAGAATALGVIIFMIGALIH